MRMLNRNRLERKNILYGTLFLKINIAKMTYTTIPAKKVLASIVLFSSHCKYSFCLCSYSILTPLTMIGSFIKKLSNIWNSNKPQKCKNICECLNEKKYDITLESVCVSIYNERYE